MDNGTNESPNQLFRRVYSDLHQAKQNSIEITQIVQEESLKIKDLLDRAPPWSIWYDQPYPVVLLLLFEATGLLEQILKLCEKKNAAIEILAFFESEPEIDNQDALTLDEQALISSLAIAVFFQVPSLSMYNQTINNLLEKAKNGDDKSLFQAITVDRTVLSTPSVAKRVQMAQLKRDNPFFKKLSKALVRKQSRRPAKKLDDVRFMISALEDSKKFLTLSNEDTYSILVEDLELYPADGKDPYKGFEKLLTRTRKIINDTK
jgi:hypothetical protein